MNIISGFSDHKYLITGLFEEQSHFLFGIFQQDSVNAVLPNCQELFWGIGVGLIIFGAIPLERAGILNVPLWMVFLGDASYSIYLAHPFVLRPFFILTSVLIAAPAPSTQIIVATVSTIAGIAGGVMSYRLLEKPLADLLSRFHMRQRPRRLNPVSPRC